MGNWPNRIPLKKEGLDQAEVRSLPLGLKSLRTSKKEIQKLVVTIHRPALDSSLQG